MRPLILEFAETPVRNFRGYRAETEINLNSLGRPM